MHISNITQRKKKREQSTRKECIEEGGFIIKISTRNIFLRPAETIVVKSFNPSDGTKVLQRFLMNR